MSGSSIQQDIRESIPDQGNFRDIDIFNILRDEAFTLIGAGTTPVAAVSSDTAHFVWAAANVDAAYAAIRLGRDLALSPSRAAATKGIPFPRFKLNLGVRMAAAAGPDQPRITVTAKLRAMGGAIKATFTPKSIETDGTTLTNGTCAAVTNTTNPELRTWDFFEIAGTGPVYAAPGDTLYLKIVPGTHGTDALHLHQAYLQVAENIAYTDERLRL